MELDRTMPPIALSQMCTVVSRMEWKEGGNLKSLTMGRIYSNDSM